MNTVKDIHTTTPIPEAKRVGTMLKGLRLRAGLSQEKLAELLNIPTAYIGMYENHRREIPRYLVDTLAKVLDTVPEHFIH